MVNLSLYCLNVRYVLAICDLVHVVETIFTCVSG